MSSYRFSGEPNPFIRGVFWGRQGELNAIYRHLQSDPPQSCALIGETYSGKTTLLRRLVDAPESVLPDEELAIRKKHVFIYFDCIAYYDSELAQKGAYASMLFWWELYNEVYTKLQKLQLVSGEKPAKPDFSAEGQHLEIAFDIKFDLEQLMRNCHRSVVIVLDNFEGVANLQLLNSHWLRALCQSACTLIAASRHLLYLTYQHEARDRQDYSPLWNLFSDPIYLGLMDEDEVLLFLQRAYEKAKSSNSVWRREDIGFIKKMAGRHPELIRIVCMHLFEYRLPSQQKQEQDLLEFNIMRDARPICNQLWSGLGDQELRIEFPIAHAAMEHENQELSPYQVALLDSIRGKEIIENSALFILDQRGLIEYQEDKWQVFSEIMRRFVLEKYESILPLDTTTQDKSGEQNFPASFTYLEGRVYAYLYSRLGQVCDREEIKKAVWQTNIPSNSALQKIIERIRDKIENENRGALHLIAVRGRGYTLRYGISDTEQDRYNL